MKHHLLYFLTLLFLFALGQAQTFQKTFGTAGFDYATDVIQTNDKGYALMGVLNNGGVYILKTDSLGNKQWSKNYGLYTPSNGEFRTFAQTSDGGFIFAGRIYYSNNYYGFTVKTDGVGNITWSRLIAGMDRFYSIKQTIDGGYIAVGNQFYLQSYKATLIKFNSSGVISWSRILPVVNNALDVIELAADSSFITCYYANNPNDNVTISRWSKNANLLWSKTLNNPKINGGAAGYGNLYENGNEVQVALNTNNCPGLLTIKKDGSSAKLIGVSCQLFNYFLSDAFPTANKGAVLVAHHNVGSAGYGTRNIILTSIDSLGAIKWTKQIGGVNDEVPAAVKQTHNKGIVIAGTTKSFSAGYDDIYLVKTDSLGQSACNTGSITFSTTTIAASLSNYTGVIDSLFINLCSTQTLSVSSPSEISTNACSCIPPIAKFTPDVFGNMNENSSWANKWYWTCTCMPGVVDSSVINKGYYGGPFPNGTYTVCLKVKNACGVDSLCQPFSYTFFPIGIKETDESLTANFYPNPVQDRLMISREESKTNTEAIRIKIFNSLGALVYTDTMEGLLKEIRAENLAPGLYIIQFTVGNKSVSRKVVKE